MSTLDHRNDRALGYDYPAGAANDPRAPYNQAPPDACETCKGEGEVDCEECDGKSCDWCDGEGITVCEDCDGTGEAHHPTRAEIEEDKADRARDEQKDRSAEGWE